MARLFVVNPVELFCPVAELPLFTGTPVRSIRKEDRKGHRLLLSCPRVLQQITASLAVKPSSEFSFVWMHTNERASSSDAEN